MLDHLRDVVVKLDALEGTLRELHKQLESLEATGKAEWTEVDYTHWRVMDVAAMRRMFLSMLSRREESALARVQNVRA